MSVVLSFSVMLGIILGVSETGFGAPAPSPAVIRTIAVTGFDPDGEPEIRLMSDGSLVVVFNFMPPSDIDPAGGGLGAFKDFDKHMERALGVPVLWEDREVIVIRKPRPDTAEKVKTFLETYRMNKRR